MQRPNLNRIATRSVLFVLLLLLLTGAGCSSTAEGEEPAEGEEVAENGDSKSKADGDEAEPAEEEKKKPKKAKERTTSIVASVVVRGDLVLPVVAEGSIRARHTAEIKFEIGGRLVEMHVVEGQRVRKGDELATIDDRDYQLSLEEANSRYLQALGQLAVEEDGYSGEGSERTLSEKTGELKRLEREGLITRQERLDRELDLGMEAVRDGAYRRELLEVRSGLATARRDIARLELDLERTVILAPFDGVITELYLDEGERAQTGDTLCRLVDDVNIEAEVGVLESDLGAVKVGRPAFLTLPALGETRRVKVDVISPDIDEESRTCSVLLRLKSKDGLVKPGMFSRASIAGQIYPDRLMVPREAVVTRDGRPVLFKVEGDRAKWVYVQLGMANDSVVEIKRIDQGGPLDPGTLVVVDNHLTLTHDAKIKVKSKRAIADPWAASE